MADINLASVGIQMIRDNLTKENITTTGKTANSLTGEDTGFRVVIKSDGRGAPFQTTQYGHDGQNVPFNFVGIIRQWVIDKGLTVTPIPFSTDNPRPDLRKHTEFERGLNRMSYFIANKIEREGTERFKDPKQNIYTPVQEFIVEEFKKRTKSAILNAYLK